MAIQLYFVREEDMSKLHCGKDCEMSGEVVIDGRKYIVVELEKDVSSGGEHGMFDECSSCAKKLKEISVGQYLVF